VTVAGRGVSHSQRADDKYMDNAVTLVNNGTMKVLAGSGTIQGGDGVQIKNQGRSVSCMACQWRDELVDRNSGAPLLQMPARSKWTVAPS